MGRGAVRHVANESSSIDAEVLKMKHRFLTIMLVFAVGAGAQLPRLTEATLSGRYYFVYGVYQRSQAQTVMGTLTFDGQGHCTEAVRSLVSQGFYSVNSDGTGSITNPLDALQPPLSLRLSAGSITIGASTLEQSVADRHDLLLAVMAPTKPPVMTGSWGGLTFLYTPGPPVLARAGRFRFLFDASGKVNSTSWTYHENDIDDGDPHDVTSTGTYSVDPSGIGTYTSAQGKKRIAVSADGNTYIGVDDGNAPEMIFATRLADGTASPTGLQRRYWWLQLDAATPGGWRSPQFGFCLGDWKRAARF
jgi:hypothetical protein